MSEARRPVIVTGAAGFVGSHLTRALLHAGRRVIATDAALHIPSDRLMNIGDGTGGGSLRFLPGDLTSDGTLDAIVDAAGEQADIVNVAAIINFGQLSKSIDGSIVTPEAALRSFAVNADAAWALCSRLAGAGALGRFVHVSTRSVFGGRAATPGRIAESTPVEPAGIYGSSKAAAELGLLALREQLQLDLVIGRITGVFGPWQGPASFIGQAVESVVKGRPHHTETGGDDAYELTYVKDTVRGLMMLVEANHLRHQIYHVASGDRLITLREVASAMAAARRSADVVFGDGRHAGSSGRTPLSIERAADELGFGTRWSLEDAMADYLRIEEGGTYGAEAVEPPWLPT